MTWILLSSSASFTSLFQRKLTQYGSGRRNRAHSLWGRDNELSRRSEGKFCQLWEKTWKGMVWLNTVNFLFRPVVFQNPHIFHSGAGQKRWSRRGGELAGDWSYQQVLSVYLQLYLDAGRSVICFQRIEEAVAGLKEGEAEVEGAFGKMERRAEALSALRSKVRWSLNPRDLDIFLPGEVVSYWGSRSC